MREKERVLFLNATDGGRNSSFLLWNYITLDGEKKLICAINIVPFTQNNVPFTQIIVPFIQNNGRVAQMKPPDFRNNGSYIKNRGIKFNFIPLFLNSKAWNMKNKSSFM